MKFEINMINVKDGDSIILQLEKTKKKSLIIIDGGYKRHYEKLERRVLELLPKYDNKIDLIVCTHYDNDHLEGISLLLDYCKQNDVEIEEIWLHKIENKLINLVDGMNSKEKELNERNDFSRLSTYVPGDLTEMFDSEKGNLVIENYRFLIALLQKIIDYGWEDRIREVVKDDFLDGFEEFQVISPTRDFYNKLLPKLKDEKFVADVQRTVEARMLSEEVDLENETDFDELIFDTAYPCDRLEKSSIENGVTPTNLVSIVTLLTVNNLKFLFTADAGIETFEDQKLLTSELKDLDWLQLPHHGSKNNTSLRMLNHFNPVIVYVSGKNAENRPSTKIKNCLQEKERFKEIHVTNEKTDTWYLKIGNDLDTEQVSWTI